VHEDEIRMKKSFGPGEAVKALGIVFGLAVLLVIILPKQTTFDPAVSFYANIYQDMYPNNVTILKREQRVKSYEILFSTSASKETVFAWYDAQYAAHGWTHILLYSSPEEERLNRYWDYPMDCRSLGLTVEYNQQQNTYRHVIILNEGRMCRRNP
jgi:hypothetical protein